MTLCYYALTDHDRLTAGDETVPLYTDNDHPALKGQLVLSTTYIGELSRLTPLPSPTPTTTSKPKKK